MFSIALIEAIAERDCHIREMLELKRVADKHSIPSRCDTILQGWVDQWLLKHPREGALLQERVRLVAALNDDEPQDSRDAALDTQGYSL